MTTGEIIFEYRKKAGLTQEELADKLGVSRQAVSKWEQDAAFPETEKILELCKLFSISADELLFGRKNAGASSAPAEVPAEPSVAESASAAEEEPQPAPEPTVHSEPSEAPPKPKKDVSKRWNLLCILGFVFAAASVGIVFFGIILPLFGDNPEPDLSKASFDFAIVCMGLGLLLSVAGLCTKKWLGRRGGFFAVIGIVILAVTLTAFLMLWFFLASLMGTIWNIFFG